MNHDRSTDQVIDLQVSVRPSPAEHGHLPKLAFEISVVTLRLVAAATTGVPSHFQPDWVVMITRAAAHTARRAVHTFFRCAGVYTPGVLRRRFHRAVSVLQLHSNCDTVAALMEGDDASHILVLNQRVRRGTSCLEGAALRCAVATQRSASIAGCHPDEKNQ
jgi:hypothetical protein